jgi:hypothetical protein
VSVQHRSQAPPYGDVGLSAARFDLISGHADPLGEIGDIQGAAPVILVIQGLAEGQGLVAGDPLRIPASASWRP